MSPALPTRKLPYTNALPTWLMIPCRGLPGRRTCLQRHLALSQILFPIHNYAIALCGAGSGRRNGAKRTRIPSRSIPRTWTEPTGSLPRDRGARERFPGSRSSPWTHLCKGLVVAPPQHLVLLNERISRWTPCYELNYSLFRDRP